jgi:hypothetical protein
VALQHVLQQLHTISTGAVQSAAMDLPDGAVLGQNSLPVGPICGMVPFREVPEKSAVVRRVQADTVEGTVPVRL